MRIVACITEASVIDQIRTAPPAGRTRGRGAPYRPVPPRAGTRHTFRAPPPRPPTEPGP